MLLLLAVVVMSPGVCLVHVRLMAPSNEVVNTAQCSTLASRLDLFAVWLPGWLAGWLAGMNS
jgi:hypothetical protein